MCVTLKNVHVDGHPGRIPDGHVLHEGSPGLQGREDENRLPVVRVSTLIGQTHSVGVAETFSGFLECRPQNPLVLLAKGPQT